MGFWFDHLVGMTRSHILLGLGVAGLAACLFAGQDWAGIALGCLLGARAMSAWRPQG